MAEKIPIINILIAYGMIQAFFMAMILMRSGKSSLFRRLFAALLVIEGIILLERLLVETELIEAVPHILGIATPISFLKPPLMLLMAYTLTIKGFRLTKKTLWHTIPFVLMLLLNLPFYALSGPQKIATVAEFMQKIPSYQSFEFYFALSFFLYIGVYIYYCIQQLDRFRVHITNHHLVNWYRIILIGYSIFLAGHLIYYLVQPLTQSNFALVNQISMLAMTFMIQSIAFKLLDQSNWFNVKTPDLSKVAQREADLKLILEKLEGEKAYLDEKLNLQLFSTSISLTSGYVSELINQKFNCSFSVLVSKYRLEEAKSIMADPPDPKMTLIEVAYQAGFSNKVSFYRAFKTFEGTSPSDYFKSQKIGKKA